MEKKEMGFMAAMKDFFGYRPGTGMKDFMDEIKALTPADRVEFRGGLEKNGYIIKA